MRIALINPHYIRSLFSAEVPGILTEDSGLYPSLGLGYIAAILEKNDHEVHYIDIDALELTAKSLRNYLLKINPDIVGITCTTHTLAQAKEIALIVKKTLPDTYVIVGGAHVAIYPHETLKGNYFDMGVIGEGEFTILEVVQAIEKERKSSHMHGLDLKNILGLVFKRNGSIFVNKYRPLIEKLDDLPFPARHLFPTNNYYSPVVRNYPFTTMITSRGCPFNCAFCLRASGTHFGRKFRYRSAKNVVDEIEEAHTKYNAKEILFYDDTFTVNKKRVFDICHELISRNLKVEWDCRTRVDCITEKMIQKMKKAGCIRIHLGVEAGTQRVLNNLRKNITLKQIKKAFRWCRDNELETLGYFMIGNPGDTLKSINRTISLAKELKPDYAHFDILQAYPGTDVYRDALESGYLKEDFWRNYTKNTTSRHPRIFLETDEYDNDALEKLLKNAYRQFYFRPSYLFKQIRKIRSAKDFFNKLRGFRSLISLR